MSIYLKLAEARKEFHSMNLKKSGKNKFAGYSYFELADFVVPGLTCLANHGLVPIVSFGAETATMTVYDTESDASFVIGSPMAEANLKGCHPIQNLGATQSYIRRYLWLALLEIVEHDAIDSAPAAEPVPARPAMKMASQNQRDTITEMMKAGGVSEEMKNRVRESWKSLTYKRANEIIKALKENGK